MNQTSVPSTVHSLDGNPSDQILANPAVDSRAVGPWSAAAHPCFDGEILSEENGRPGFAPLPVLFSSPSSDLLGVSPELIDVAMERARGRDRSDGWYWRGQRVRAESLLLYQEWQFA